ncbi:MAG: hypothetical protein ACYC3X_14255 [Pirellulaceae bacterium]
MPRLRLLAWEYGIRNLFRRPTRTGLTLSGLTTVVFLVFVVVAFIRGLETSLAASGDPRVVLVYSIGAAEDVENSTIAAHIPALLSASLDGIERRYGVSYVSPELYIATRLTVNDNASPLQAVIRGVTPAAPLLRPQVQMRVDSVSTLVGCGTGLLMELLGAIPPALKSMRISVVQGLKSV